MTLLQWVCGFRLLKTTSCPHLGGSIVPVLQFVSTLKYEYSTLGSNYPVTRHRISEEQNPWYDTVSADETGYHMRTCVTVCMLSFVSQIRIWCNDLLGYNTPYLSRIREFRKRMLSLSSGSECMVWGCSNFMQELKKKSGQSGHKAEDRHLNTSATERTAVIILDPILP
jgi:hypothetical protein